jgi:hypothetical protein
MHKLHRDDTSNNLIPNLMIDSEVEKYILSYLQMSKLFSLRTTSKYWNHIILEYHKDFARKNPQWITLFFETLLWNLERSNRKLTNLKDQLQDETEYRKFVYMMILSFFVVLYALLYISVLIGGGIMIQTFSKLGEGISRLVIFVIIIFGGGVITGIVCCICGGCAFAGCYGILRALERVVLHNRLMNEIEQQQKTVYKLKQNIREWKRRLSIV